MDLDETAVKAWARRDDAETILRYLLGETAQPALKYLRGVLGAAPGDPTAADLIMRGQSAVVWPWRNQMHLKYAVPGESAEERLRLQFLAAGSEPFFTIETRYDHPREKGVLELESLMGVRDRLGPDFKIGNDGYGYYWARVLSAEHWLLGQSTLDQLLVHARENIERFAASGIFTALADLKPSTPASVPPVGSEDSDTPSSTGGSTASSDEEEPRAARNGG